MENLSEASSSRVEECAGRIVSRVGTSTSNFEFNRDITPVRNLNNTENPRGIT